MRSGSNRLLQLFEPFLDRFRRARGKNPSGNDVHLNLVRFGRVHKEVRLQISLGFGSPASSPPLKTHQANLKLDFRRSNRLREGGGPPPISMSSECAPRQSHRQAVAQAWLTARPLMTRATAPVARDCRLQGSLNRVRPYPLKDLSVTQRVHRAPRIPHICTPIRCPPSIRPV